MNDLEKLQDMQNSFDSQCLKVETSDYELDVYTLTFFNNSVLGTDLHDIIDAGYVLVEIYSKDGKMIVEVRKNE